jgi:hypothetical protein
MTAVLIKRYAQLAKPTIPVTKWCISGYLYKKVKFTLENAM